MNLYFIGQRGPEVFSPRLTGRIVPSPATRRKGVSVPAWAWLALGILLGVIVDRVVL